VRSGYRPAAEPDADKLTPADPRDLADAIAFSLNFEGRKQPARPCSAWWCS
jgi:hypothetical protein